MSDDFRVAPGDYPPRYGPGSLYAPVQPVLRGPGCTHVAPDSCPVCDGSDVWADVLAYRTIDANAEQQRARQMARSREFRAAWLLTFHDPDIRREQADWADLRYGAMPGLLHDIDEKASA